MLKKLVPPRSSLYVRYFASIVLAQSSTSHPINMEQATVAGGCFWCVEAPYSELKGVQSAISGYIGGSKLNPTYREVCNGDTGHAEAVRITFDPATRK